MVPAPAGELVVVRKCVALVALAVAALVAVALSAAVSAQPASEHVVMAPAEGTLQTRFVFTGAGFVPARTISMRITPPDGVERRMRTDVGAELVWVVQADGGFALDFVPSSTFPDAPPGQWRALFCQFGSTTCQQLDFDVLP